MNYTKGDFIYEGKAKQIYSVLGEKELVWLHFKNDLTAFNAEKKGSFDGKGRVNCKIAHIIFKYLENQGVKTHFVAAVSETDHVVKKVDIIPLEVVVRNITAGSTAKRLGLKDGQLIDSPLVEFYYKDDSLGDPFINDEQALYLEAARSMDELSSLKEVAREVNNSLRDLFSKIEIDLVDFKIEFGRINNTIVLADEISPDSCRLWDKNTGEKMDKDRFRHDLGNVKEKYIELLNRIETVWEDI